MGLVVIFATKKVVNRFPQAAQEHWKKIQKNLWMRWKHPRRGMCWKHHMPPKDFGQAADNYEHWWCGTKKLAAGCPPDQRADGSGEENVDYCIFFLTFWILKQIPSDDENCVDNNCEEQSSVHVQPTFSNPQQPVVVDQALTTAPSIIEVKLPQGKSLSPHDEERVYWNEPDGILIKRSEFGGVLPKDWDVNREELSGRFFYPDGNSMVLNNLTRWRSF